MTCLLKAFGHSTLLAADGVEALKVARREVPDLVICDIQVPLMNGYDLARAPQAGRKLAGIPRVAVTALAMVTRGNKCLTS
jgi:two-component system cell cycle response regulator